MWEYTFVAIFVIALFAIKHSLRNKFNFSKYRYIFLAVFVDMILYKLITKPFSIWEIFVLLIIIGSVILPDIKKYRESKHHL